MKETIKNLQKEREQLSERMSKIDKAIFSLQQVCEHLNQDGTNAMEYKGSTSHTDEFQCVICGYQKTN